MGKYCYYGICLSKIWNPVESVWYYHLPFLKNVDTQVYSTLINCTPKKSTLIQWSPLFSTVLHLSLVLKISILYCTVPYTVLKTSLCCKTSAARQSLEHAIAKERPIFLAASIHNELLIAEIVWEIVAHEHSREIADIAGTTQSCRGQLLGPSRGTNKTAGTPRCLGVWWQ